MYCLFELYIEGREGNLRLLFGIHTHTCLIWPKICHHQSSAIGNGHLTLLCLWTELISTPMTKLDLIYPSVCCII